MLRFVVVVLKGSCFGLFIFVCHSQINHYIHRSATTLKLQVKGTMNNGACTDSYQGVGGSSGGGGSILWFVR